MKVDTQRAVDRAAGMPLCWALTLARRAARLLTGAPVLPAPRRILIIKLSEMGSTVLAAPALRELKSRWPDSELFFLVFSNNAAILEALNLVPAANIVTVDERSASRLLASGARAVRRLRAARIDTTIDMDFFSRLTAAFAFLVCRGNRVGCHRYNEEGRYRGNLLTHRVLYSPHLHTSAQFMALVRTLAEDPADEPHYRGRIDARDLTIPRHVPAVADVASVRAKLDASGVRDAETATLVLINPNSSEIFPLRKWPLDRFAELSARVMAAAPHVWLIITGLASEQADARVILERVASPRCIDFTGRTSCRELLALYAMATAMVTNDSGPAHFASLLDLPTIVLFGPETPRLYAPLGHHHVDLYAEFACSPCVSVYNSKKSTCRDNRCLKSIGVDRVLTEVLTILSTAAAAMPVSRSERAR